MEIVFSTVLPWPHMSLSPNARKHWIVGATVKQSFRERCRIESSVSWQDYAGTFDASCGYVLRLVFVTPSARHYDLDNLLSRMKAGIDGMCDTIGINDRQFYRVEVESVTGNRKTSKVIVLLLREGLDEKMDRESIRREASFCVCKERGGGMENMAGERPSIDP